MDERELFDIRWFSSTFLQLVRFCVTFRFTFSCFVFVHAFVSPYGVQVSLDFICKCTRSVSFKKTSPGNVQSSIFAQWKVFLEVRDELLLLGRSVFLMTKKEIDQSMRAKDMDSRKKKIVSVWKDSTKHFFRPGFTFIDRERFFKAYSLEHIISFILRPLRINLIITSVSE